MFHIGMIVYMTSYLCPFIQIIAIIKSFNIFKNLKYTDFQINIKSFHELRNDKHLADVTLVTENNIQVRPHKIILSSRSIKNILHILTVYEMQD